MDEWKHGVWEIASYSWTEIGLSQHECDRLVESYGLKSVPLAAIRSVVFRDVAGSFAWESFLVLPLMLWILLPDWCYERDYLRKRAVAWYNTPRLIHFLNPARVLGYPIAAVFVIEYWRMIRRAHRSASNGPST